MSAHKYQSVRSLSPVSMPKETGVPSGRKIVARDVYFKAAKRFAFAKKSRHLGPDQGRCTYGTLPSFPPLKMTNLLLHWLG